MSRRRLLRRCLNIALTMLRRRGAVAAPESPADAMRSRRIENLRGSDEGGCVERPPRTLRFSTNGNGAGKLSTNGDGSGKISTNGNEARREADSVESGEPHSTRDGDASQTPLHGVGHRLVADVIPFSFTAGMASVIVGSPRDDAPHLPMHASF